MNPSSRKNIIVTIGQFRPEKNHLLQLDILHEIIKSIPDAKLIMIGGARNKDDYNLIEEIKRKAESLNLLVISFRIILNLKLI